MVSNKIDQYNQILINIINSATKGVESAVAFGKEQLPDVIHQLLIYNFTISLIIFIAVMLGNIILITVMIIGIRKAFKMWNDDGYVMIIGLLLIPLGALNANFLSDSMVWLKIYLAPKVYLIEYAAHLVQSKV